MRTEVSVHQRLTRRRLRRLHPRYLILVFSDKRVRLFDPVDHVLHVLALARGYLCECRIEEREERENDEACVSHATRVMSISWPIGMCSMYLVVLF